MKNLLIVVFGFLVTGCCHSSGQQKPSVACDTFDYAVKEGDTLRMDRYTLPAWDKESRRPCLIFLFGGAFTHGTRNAGQYRPFFDYLLENAQIVGTPGAGFGENGKNYFRLTSFGLHEKTAEAMERFDRLF